jgi:hypothetical protein
LNNTQLKKRVLAVWTERTIKEIKGNEGYLKIETGSYNYCLDEEEEKEKTKRREMEILFRENVICLE